MKRAIMLAIVVGLLFASSPVSVTRAQSKPPMLKFCLNLKDLPLGAFTGLTAYSPIHGKLGCDFHFEQAVDVDGYPVAKVPAIGSSLDGDIVDVYQESKVDRARGWKASEMSGRLAYPQGKKWAPALLGDARQGYFSPIPTETYSLQFRRGHFLAELRGVGYYQLHINRSIIAGYARLMDSRVAAYIKAHPTAN